MTHAQMIATFDEQAEMRGEAHRQRAEMRAATERNTLLAQQHRADLDTIRELRTALTAANQENEILMGELATARNSQPAIDWLGREM